MIQRVILMLHPALSRLRRHFLHHYGSILINWINHRHQWTPKMIVAIQLDQNRRKQQPQWLAAVHFRPTGTIHAAYRQIERSIQIDETWNFHSSPHRWSFSFAQLLRWTSSIFLDIFSVILSFLIRIIAFLLDQFWWVTVCNSSNLNGERA